MMINFDKNNNIINIDKNYNNETYQILRRKDETYDLFIKYADDKIKYYIRNFKDLYECLQYVEVGVIKNI